MDPLAELSDFEVTRNDHPKCRATALLRTTSALLVVSAAFSATAPMNDGGMCWPRMWKSLSIDLPAESPSP
jgi:hypothetical protein